jgi:hypothetical protein
MDRSVAEVHEDPLAQAEVDKHPLRLAYLVEEIDEVEVVEDLSQVLGPGQDMVSFAALALGLVHGEVAGLDHERALADRMDLMVVVVG